MLDWSNVEILARSAKDNPDAIEELYELMQPAILWQAKRMSAGGRITDELISRLNYAFMMAVNCYANESRTTCSFVNYLHHMMRSYAWNLRKQETKPLV
ncbi:MAG: sigma-70 family RNA polymerase sigma factor, partial [Methanobacteriota archaeon]